MSLSWNGECQRRRFSFSFVSLHGVFRHRHSTFYLTAIYLKQIEQCLNFILTIKYGWYSTGVSEVCFGGAKYPTIGNFIRGPVYSEGYDDFLNNCDFFSRDTTLHYNTIRNDTIQNDTIRFETIRYNTIRYDTIRYDTTRLYSIPFNSIRCETIRYDTIQYDTIVIWNLTVCFT